jgi:hypothetical protein
MVVDKLLVMVQKAQDPSVRRIVVGQVIALIIERV